MASVISNETQNMYDCEGAADLWSVPAALAYPAHTCTFYTCPLLWLPGYGMESKATVSELGVFNLPQSLRACASAHVIHHVDQNMPQTNGASALCRSRRAVTGRSVGAVAPTSGRPERRRPRDRRDQTLRATSCRAVRLKAFILLSVREATWNSTVIPREVLSGQAQEFREAWKEEMRKDRVTVVGKCEVIPECVWVWTCVTCVHPLSQYLQELVRCCLARVSAATLVTCRRRTVELITKCLTHTSAPSSEWRSHLLMAWANP